MGRHSRYAVRTLVALTLAASTAAAWYAGAIVYDRLTLQPADCGGGYAAQTPAAFGMTEYDLVSFPSRGESGVTISGWWVAGNAGAPAVVLVHGSGECKRATSVLGPASMLNRHGFGVLLVDLRNEGASTIVNGRLGGGIAESRDVLGAWDWLRTAKGLPAGRIGLWGISLGAGTIVIAAGEERGVAAVWEDSGYAEFCDVMAHQTARRGFPPWFAYLGLEVGRLRGEETCTPSPEWEAGRIGSRPFAIIHGERDGLVPVEHGRRLERAVEAGGGRPQVWYLDGVGHGGAQFSRPEEYERRMAAFFEASLGAADA